MAAAQKIYGVLKKGRGTDGGSGSPPVAGAQQAKDGKWYVKREGKWYRVE